MNPRHHQCANTGCDRFGGTVTLFPRTINSWVHTWDTPFCSTCGQEMMQVAPTTEDN